EEAKATEEALRKEKEAKKAAGKKDSNILFDVEAIRRELALQDAENKIAQFEEAKAGSPEITAPRPPILHTHSKYDRETADPLYTKNVGKDEPSISQTKRLSTSSSIDSK